MKRREFLHQGLVAGSAFAAATRAASGATRKHAYDTVYLGPDKVKLSRLAMGTGTSGFGGASNQTRQLGTGGVADLFWFGYGQRRDVLGFRRSVRQSSAPQRGAGKRAAGTRSRS